MGVQNRILVKSGYTIKFSITKIKKNEHKEYKFRFWKYTFSCQIFYTKCMDINWLCNHVKKGFVFSSLDLEKLWHKLDSNNQKYIWICLLTTHRLANEQNIRFVMNQKKNQRTFKNEYIESSILVISSLTLCALQWNNQSLRVLFLSPIWTMSKIKYVTLISITSFTHFYNVKALSRDYLDSTVRCIQFKLPAVWRICLVMKVIKLWPLFTKPEKVYFIIRELLCNVIPGNSQLFLFY